MTLPTRSVDVTGISADLSPATMNLWQTGSTVAPWGGSTCSAEPRTDETDVLACSASALSGRGLGAGAGSQLNHDSYPEAAGNSSNPKRANGCRRVEVSPGAPSAKT